MIVLFLILIFLAILFPRFMRFMIGMVMFGLLYMCASVADHMHDNPQPTPVKGHHVHS